MQRGFVAPHAMAHQLWQHRPPLGFTGYLYGYNIAGRQDSQARKCCNFSKRSQKKDVGVLKKNRLETSKIFVFVFLGAFSGKCNVLVANVAISRG